MKQVKHSESFDTGQCLEDLSKIHVTPRRFPVLDCLFCSTSVSISPFQSELTSVSDIKSPGWHRGTSAGNSLRPLQALQRGWTEVKLNSISSQF